MHFKKILYVCMYTQINWVFLSPHEGGLCGLTICMGIIPDGVFLRC